MVKIQKFLYLQLHYKEIGQVLYILKHLDSLTSSVLFAITYGFVSVLKGKCSEIFDFMSRFNLLPCVSHFR
jgi:hypothetical protein